MKSIELYESSVVGEAREWVSKHVGCLAGRREMQKGRIMINAVANKLDVLMGYAAFVSALHRREAVACLFIPIHTGMESASTTVIERLQPLADLMSVLSSANPEDLVSGGHLGKVIRTSCPVTNHIMDFDDFNGIAFTPEAMNREDPLYDPMMSAPFPCMTLNSDHFAFSMFTRDLCLADHGCEVYQLDDPTLRRQLFEHAGTKWQVMACRTIANYVAITDGTLCPTWLAEDERHWYASHQDPAFAESSKELHRHEMPTIYTPRIIAAWETSFATNKPPRLSDATTVGSLCPNALAQAG